MTCGHVTSHWSHVPLHGVGGGGGPLPAACYGTLECVLKTLDNSDRRLQRWQEVCQVVINLFFIIISVPDHCWVCGLEDLAGFKSYDKTEEFRPLLMFGFVGRMKTLTCFLRWSATPLLVSLMCFWNVCYMMWTTNMLHPSLVNKER